MKIYYPGKAYLKVANAGAKPKADIEAILQSLGARPLGFESRYTGSSFFCKVFNRLSGVWGRLTVPRGGYAVIQFPIVDYDLPLVRRLIARGVKIVFFVHDIDSLRGKPNPFEALFAEAEAIIVHTPAMKRWVEQYTKARLTILDVFDYISHVLALPAPREYAAPFSIVFAGNLQKAPFLEKLDFDPAVIRLKLFGVNPSQALLARPYVDYKGSCLPDEIPARICGYDFGLVWDGTSPDGCDGDFGTYLRYNSPFKFSSYMAAGVPAIVWSGMGIAPYVSEKGLGIVIDSLRDLPAVLEGITPARYADLRRRVAAEQKAVLSGDHYRRALARALELDRR